VQSIQEWLDHLGLGQYAVEFKKHDIDGAIVPKLTDQDWAQLGVSLGHRKLLLAALEKSDLAPGSASTTPLKLKTIAGIENSTVDGERRQVTVLYCDLVESTALSRAHDPEKLWQILGRYHESCVHAIKEHEGFVAQIQGDGVLAYFGYPIAHENAAVHAISAGIEIPRALNKLNVEIGESLRVRIGVASGIVVVSHILALHKTAVGETPNLAHRLQSLANPGDVIVSEHTRLLAGGTFDFEDWGPRDLRGVPEATHVWRVVRASDVASRFEAATSSGLTAMVGREPELSALLDLWKTARRGAGQIVLVRGEPGIGKSRALRELCDRIEQRAFIPRKYQCLPNFANRPFFPIVDQLERDLAFIHEDNNQQKFEKLERKVIDELGRSTRDCNLLGRILDLPCDSRYGRLESTPQRQKDHTIDLLVDLVVTAARHDTRVLIFEDLHWADPTTIEFLSSLVKRVSSVPLLVAATARDEFKAPWCALCYSTEIAMGRLSRSESEQLIAQVAQPQSLSVNLVTQIIDHADGVPLFLEELTKSVLESTEVFDHDKSYRPAGAASTTAVPLTLRDSLMARLDRLIPVKELAQIGAVIGREFSFKLLAALAPIPEPELGEALKLLVDSGLVFQHGAPPSSVYFFKHALVQDTAYDSLLKSKRQYLHLAIARVLEERFPETCETAPEILALHYERAGLFEVAVKWFIASGQRAQARSAYREAIQSYERSLSLLARLSDAVKVKSAEIEIRSHLGMLYLMLEGFSSLVAREHFTRAYELSAGSNHDHRFPALVGLVEILSWDFNKSEASGLGEKLLHLAAESGARVHALYAHQVRGRSNMYRGRFREALVESQRAIEIYNEEADVSLAFEYGYDPGVFALSSIAYSYFILGYHERAAFYTDRCVALARRIGHAYTLSFALAIPGADIWYLMHDPEKAIQFAHEGQEVSAKWGFGYLKSMCDLHAGWATAMLGRHAEGLECMTRALQTIEKMGPWAAVTPRMIAQLASVYAAAGRADDALSVLESSPDRQNGRKRVRYAEIYRIEGDLHRLKCNPDRVRAEICYKEAIEIAIEDEAKPYELRAVTRLATLWQEQGKTTQAYALLAPLIAWFTEGFEFQDLREAKAALDALNACQSR
jgi:class 3 adenylate cyclase/tetratricopeptide (TPR) repeat protein